MKYIARVLNLKGHLVGSMQARHPLFFVVCRVVVVE
jgi:hypothetical protein